MKRDFDTRWDDAADRSGGPLACWPWLKKGTNGGYGRIRYGNRLWYAHRLAFYLANGRRQPEAVCHRCDNPPCVNPAHLRAGTLSDNCAEMWAKGRARSPVVNAKLTPEQVALIRARYRGGVRNTASLGAEFGVSGRTVYRLIFGPCAKSYQPALTVAA